MSPVPMIRLLTITFFLLPAFAGPSSLLAIESTPAPFAGTMGEWHGFTSHEFEIAGKPVLVVTPDNPIEGRPWVWHGEFFGHKPAPDVELLKLGFHCVYMKIPDMLGSPEAVEYWNQCYQELTDTYGLARKVALVGLSRGGLYCYNWAAANPEKVSCIYGDAPVCDFKSWPGGRGKGPGSERDWKLVLQRYRFANEAEALAYRGNPVDRLKPLAEAGVPLLHVYGDADEVVPWDENTGLLAERYRELGGDIQLITKPGVKHHPHGLHDPTPIVEFIASAAGIAYGTPRKPRKDPVDQRVAQIEPTSRVVYKTVDDRELYLHVLNPDDLQDGEQRPCFIVIHGGGWTGGEPRRMYPFADHYRDQGLVGISVQYRLLNAKKGVNVFDCISDTNDAVRFVRSHAEMFNIDPNKIIVSGGSAGGHLAAETALYSDSSDSDISTVPAALVLLFPVIDTSEAGYGNARIGSRWREVSPAHQVDGKVPPTILFHGTGDTVTPFAGAVAFTEAMKKQGNRCELVVHEGGRHGYLMFDEALLNETLRQSDEFLSSLNLLNNQ
ncbi:alpha/beta hydrolase fold domain-containing protein [Rubinisphaera margarita]|uniref:alpha/beta hydrolase fold domain-containing protein n=1 Tax=Rubinisphaera margarita TaxID=2909586 RepID=UPI001EE898AF|nr:alpha/beta hydrolase fold domain-containing protein [Rubinisphaera margarita]MCG6156493.1 prolyl oligopeptidase family serine peptidase [Rubinisphaera margarita]